MRQSYDKKVCYHLSQYKPEFWKVMNEPSQKAKYCNTDFECSMTNITYTNIYLRHYITRSWEEYVWKVTQRGYFRGTLRTLENFFVINPDMLPLKEELMKSIDNKKEQ